MDEQIAPVFEVGFQDAAKFLTCVYENDQVDDRTEKKLLFVIRAGMIGSCLRSNLNFNSEKQQQD